MDYQNIETGCGCGGTTCDNERVKDTARRVAGEEAACCTPTETETVSCGCGSSTSNEVTQLGHPQAEKKRLDIGFLYLDLSTCTRCQGTESNLQEAIAEVVGILKATGTEVTVNNIHVQSEAQAREHGFVCSSTIRLNGQDI